MPTRGEPAATPCAATEPPQQLTARRNRSRHVRWRRLHHGWSRAHRTRLLHHGAGAEIRRGDARAYGRDEANAKATQETGTRSACQVKTSNPGSPEFPEILAADRS